jgi:hypothetical protein
VKPQPRYKEKQKHRNPENTQLRSNVLLERTQKLVLFVLGLEHTVTKLGGSVDPLEVDLLESLAGGVGEEGFSEGEDTLLDTWARALDENEVVLDLTISGETTERSLLQKLAYTYNSKVRMRNVRWSSW